MRFDTKEIKKAFGIGIVLSSVANNLLWLFTWVLNAFFSTSSWYSRNIGWVAPLVMISIGLLIYIFVKSILDINLEFNLNFVLISFGVFFLVSLIYLYLLSWYTGSETVGFYLSGTLSSTSVIFCGFGAGYLLNKYQFKK